MGWPGPLISHFCGNLPVYFIPAVPMGAAVSLRIKSSRSPPNPSSHQNLNFVARNRRGRGKLQPDLHLHAALHNPQRHQVAKSPHRTHKKQFAGGR